MAAVELYLRRYETFTLELGTVHLERLVCLLRVGRVPPLIVLECFVDYGAYLTIFPQRIWEQFRQEIQWPTAQEEAQLPEWCKGFAGATGGKCKCRLGRVTLEFFDLERPSNIIGPTDIFALFAFDDGTMKKTLIGLDGSTYSSRRLLLAYDVGRSVLRQVR